MPTLLAGLHHLGPARAAELGQAICAQPMGSHAGLAFNVSRLLASRALAGRCR